MFTAEFIKSLPKADLHRHYDGCIRPESVLEIAKEQNIKLPTEDLDVLKSKIMMSNDCQSLVEYLNAFDIVNLILQKEENITRTMYECCEDAHNDGLTYVEFRFAPILHTKGGLSYEQVMNAMIAGIKRAEATFNIVVRLIICAMRHLDSEKSMEAAKLAVQYKDNYVVGFDLAGAEDGFPPSIHRDACEYCYENGLHITIHGGEAAGHESVDEAIACHATRIGHGVRSIESAETMKTLREKNIAIEACVTSNTQTKAIQNLEGYPLKQFKENGIKVTINTDNTTVSNCTLSGEIQIFCEKYHLTNQDLHDLLLNSFQVAFIKEQDIKEKLIQDTDRKLKELLKL